MLPALPPPPATATGNNKPGQPKGHDLVFHMINFPPPGGCVLPFPWLQRTTPPYPNAAVSSFSTACFLPPLNYTPRLTYGEIVIVVQSIQSDPIRSTDGPLSAPSDARSTTPHPIRFPRYQRRTRRTPPTSTAACVPPSSPLPCCLIYFYTHCYTLLRTQRRAPPLQQRQC